MRWEKPFFNDFSFKEATETSMKFNTLERSFISLLFSLKKTALLVFDGLYVLILELAVKIFLILKT